MDNYQILNKIREYYKLERNKDFANFFGISQQNANAWYKRGYLDYCAIYSKCPDINPDWLLSGGEGEMIRPASQSINGDNNTQVGGNMMASERMDDLLEKALDSLKEQQELTRAAQVQAGELIGIIKSVTAKNDV